MKQLVSSVVVVGVVAVLSACSSASGGRRTGGDPSEGAGPACARTADCGAGQACVVVQGVGACSLSCSASGNECSGQASCGSVGSVSADFCQQPPPSGEPSAESPPEPDEQPSIPCTTDEECDALERGAVCGTFQGERGCTIPCTARSQCNPPSLGGVTTNFLDCATDEGDASRTVCLPDPACITSSDPLRCVTIGTPIPSPTPIPGI